jgi:putative nucleotidyltransferase with HDIG domain
MAGTPTTTMHMKTSVIAYVYAIVTFAAVALVGLYIEVPRIDLNLLVGSFCYALLGFLGSQFRYRVQGNTLGEISFIPYLTALVLYPSWATVALVGVGAAFGELRRPKPAVKRAFNIAQFTLAASVASLLYLAFGGKPLQLDVRFSPIPHSVAVLSFLLVNTFSVAAAIGLAEGKSILKTWYTGNSQSLVYDLVAIPIVYLFARSYVDWGMWGFLSMTVLAVGFRVLYQVRHQLATTNRELLELFVHTVEYGDPYTSGHSQRVSRYSRIIARAIGLAGHEVERIAIAALLHDVGKIHEIFRPILTKPGRLTTEERAIMELHPIKSAELVSKLSEFHDIVPAVRHHHENWDGTGYPDRIAGKAIPLGSRIIMFADTIDAMTSDRAYRKAMTEVEVRAELIKYRGKQFDPTICDALLDSPLYHQLFVPADSRSNTLSFTQIIERAKGQRPQAVA